MDSDSWISRLAAAKRHYLNQRQQNSQSDRLDFDEYEVEEEVRPDFPCPYCYEDHDIASLCSHLEDEHPFESKVAEDKRRERSIFFSKDKREESFVVARIDFDSLNHIGTYYLIISLVFSIKVCPICSVKVARDMLSHITLQHGHLYKSQRRRRLRRVAIPNSQGLSLLGRELREAHLQVLLGSGTYRSSNTGASTAATDSLLSSIVLNFPSSEAEEISKSSFSSGDDFVSKNTTPAQIRKSSIDLSLSKEEREQKQWQATVRANFVQDLLLSTLFGD